LLIDKKHLSLAAKNINDKAPGCKATFVYGDISDKEIQLPQKFEAILYQNSHLIKQMIF
jgi:hypothetical protein